MKYALWFVLALFCIDVNILSAALQTAEVQPFPAELRDPTFLRQLTWLADKSLENAVAGWPEYTGNQGFEEKTVKRRTRIRIGEFESFFEAEYRIHKSKGDAEIILMNTGASEVTADCDTLFTWTKQAFGQPETVVNLSTPKSDNSFTDLSADWLFGETRVQFSCSGVWIGNKFIPALTSLRYNQRERLAALEDPIHLECSAQQRWTSHELDQTVRERPPIGFIINPNSNSLLRANGSFFGKTEKFTDEEIVAGFEDETAAVQIRIDRVTASYLLTGRGKKDSRIGFDQWGKCLRVAPGKKF